MRTSTTDISDLAVIATPLVLLDCIEQAIIVLTNDRRIRYANQAAVEMLGSQDAHAGPDRLDATSFVSGTDLDAAIAELNQTSAAAVRIRVASGTGRFEMSLTDHRSTAGVDGFVASFRSLEHEEALDATLALHRQHAEHLLSALTDDLTGLPTRRLFLDRLGDRLRGRRSTRCRCS